jgi:hypothetical protein
MAHFKLEPPWLFAAGTISLQLGASALALSTLAAIKSK